MNVDVSESDTFVDRIEVNEGEELILFYGDGCQYCSLVNDYIDKNNLESNINLQVKEVYFNETNSAEFEQKFSNCNPQPPFRGVPLLWHGAYCIMGEQEIIDYLGQLVN